VPSPRPENDNKTHTYTCNDGTWNETVSLTAHPGGLAAPAGSLQVVASGALTVDSRIAGASGIATYLDPRP
jgi:hypothetical protein